MSKLLCPKCEVEFKPEINGVGVVETASFGPYKLWRADLWKCPKCGTEVVSGFANTCLAEHFQETFPESLKNLINTAPRVIYDNER